MATYLTKLIALADANDLCLRLYRSPPGWSGASAEYGVELSSRREGIRVEVTVENCNTAEDAAEAALAKWKPASRGLPALAAPSAAD